jgi:hypothetical protein
MRIDWALPCRYAETLEDGTATLIGATLDSIWLPELPGDVDVYLVVRVAAPPDEFEEQHRLEVRVVAPDRSEQQAMQIEFGPLERPALLHPGMEGGLSVVAQLGWPAEEYGLWTLELYLDGQRQRSIPILARDPAELESQT